MALPDHIAGGGLHAAYRAAYRRVLLSASPVCKRSLYSIIDTELERYLNAEKRALIQGVEKLWDKYAVSFRELEKQRNETLKTLDGFLEKLGYFGEI